MLLLALDTATPQISVALHDGERVLAETSAGDARRHGELLAPSIREVLSRAGQQPRAVTAIVTGVGPGPYTGLRVGVVTARVLGAALQVPVHGLCTLDVIACEAALIRRSIPPGGPFAVATDARRREVYWAGYGPDGQRLSGPAVNRPADLPAGPTAGQGAWLYPDSLGPPADPEFPSAAVLAALAARRLESGGTLLPAQPLYLRRPDVRQPGPPKAVTPR